MYMCGLQIKQKTEMYKMHLHVVRIAVSSRSTDGKGGEIELNRASGAGSDCPRTIGVVRIAVRMIGTFDHST